MDSFVSSMVSILVFFSSAMLGCVILHCQIREVTSFPFEFDDVRDSDGTIYKTVPSKRYYTDPINWANQYKRTQNKRGFSFGLPSAWRKTSKRRDFTFSLPGYWSHSRGVSPQGSLDKRSLISSEHPLHDLSLCDDMPELKSILNAARQAIAKIQDDCAVTTLPLDRCLTSEELDTLKQLYVTAKKGAEQLGWCLVESNDYL